MVDHEQMATLLELESLLGVAVREAETPESATRLRQLWHNVRLEIEESLSKMLLALGTERQGSKSALRSSGEAGLFDSSSQNCGTCDLTVKVPGLQR